MTDIYLSHAPDDRLWAGELAGLLEQSGYEVWREVSAMPGEDLVDARRRYRAQANCVLIVWPAEALLAQWVEEDHRYGQAQSNVLCVAQVAGDVKSPHPNAAILELGQLQQGVPADAQRVEELLNQLGHICQPSRPSVESAAVRATEIARRREQEQRAKKTKANAAARKYRQRSVVDQNSGKILS